MNKQVFIFANLFFLMSLHFISNGQDSLEVEKYKVYSDAINQIQYNYLDKEVKDTVQYYPIFLKKKTVFESDETGFEMYEYIQRKTPISEIKMTNIRDYLIIENNKYIIGLDTLFIKLHYLIDSLSYNKKKLSKSFFFETKVIFTNKPKRKQFGFFNVDIMKFWERFYKKHPNSFGIFEVSDIVFSKDKKKAILYIGYQRRSLNGYGAVYLLIKENDKWKIIKKRGIWIS